eukprot:4313831-Prymnesium_polylepis.1
MFEESTFNDATSANSGGISVEDIAAGDDKEAIAHSAASTIDIPLEVRLNKRGQMNVCKNVAYCDQPPYKTGCCGGVGRSTGGADKHNN